MADWQDKVVVVTGGSSGLGRRLAEAFAADRARVVIAARGADALERTASEIRAAGGRCLTVETDVTCQQSVEQLMDRAIGEFGRLDVLVNNAGRSMRRAILDTSAEDFQQLMELNLLGVVRCTRAAMPHLLESKGHLVNIGSLAGKATARYLGAYPATKFAVTAYSQQLRLELEPQGLHVLLVCPGPILRERRRQESAVAVPQVAGVHAAAAGDHDQQSLDQQGTVERTRPQYLEALPPQARQPGGGLRTQPIHPERLARAILAACRRRQPELIYPRSARLALAVMQLSPRLADWLIRKLT